MSDQPEPRGGILSPAHLATTAGMFSLIAFVAFEAMAVATVMPTVSRDLDGIGLYALAFAAPLASGVIGMVAAGGWSDQRGPVRPLLVAMVLFATGMVVCGLAPTMPVLVVGRVIQGLGSGALIVALYVVTGRSFPPRLQPSVFASFAAAWVLPSLFGPAIAAFVADAVGWRWVFLGVVALVALAAALIGPALRRLPDRATPKPGDGGRRLGWAALAAVAVLAVELLGSHEDATAALALPALGLVLVALRRLTPAGTLRVARGLPAVIATRGLLSASFFCSQAYIAFSLQELWGRTPAQAGLALTVVGVVWAGFSQLQARLGSRISHHTAMRVGATGLTVGMAVSLLAVRGHDSLPAWTVVAGFTVAGAGMGLGYPRTSVAMLAESTDDDRGFNSSALSIADSLGAALALSIAGVAFAVAERAGGEPFLAVSVVGAVLAVLAVAGARRTAHPAAAPHRDGRRRG